MTIVLPRVLQRWMPVLGLGELPSEPRASCERCVMCSEDDWTARFPRVRFDASVRCCTYTPGLYNFQVGAMLARPATVTAHGLRSVRDRIESAQGWPIGLVPPEGWDERYAAAREAGGFGRDRSLRCPHHTDDGGCGIWGQRNATCATWFCRHERGMLGLGMWSATRHTLAALELALARTALERVYPEGLEGSWDDWAGDREALYVATFEVASKLELHELRAGEREVLEREAEVARAARGAHDRVVLPEAPELVGVDVMEDLGDRVRVAGYTVTDTVVLPVRLLKLLDRFDGRPVGEVRDELAAFGVVVDDVMLRRLVEHDILR